MILELGFDEIFIANNLHINVTSSGLAWREFMEQEAFLASRT
jgi:hypothetical protein